MVEWKDESIKEVKGQCLGKSERCQLGSDDETCCARTMNLWSPSVAKNGR